MRLTLVSQAWCDVELEALSCTTTAHFFIGFFRTYSLTYYYAEMSALSLLYKAIAVGILLLSLTIHAKPGTILQQPIDSNILYKSQRAMGQDLNQEDCMPTTSQENDINGAAEQWWWSSSSKDESQGSDGYLKSFSHPAFPEYSMRYKTPEICDPSVKQVSHITCFTPFCVLGCW